MRDFFSYKLRVDTISIAKPPYAVKILHNFLTFYYAVEYAGPFETMYVAKLIPS